jgi:rhodanese-related sulfurtransferase
MSVIRAKEFNEKLPGNIVVIDVRTPDEFQREHLPHSRNVPLDEIEKGGTHLIPSQDEVYLICKSGQRSQRAFEILKKSGFKNLYYVEGGLSECQKCDVPVISKTRIIPLMRQVQIAAGTLVVVGILLGILVHPGFNWMAAFVGGGLVFAGITGFCGLARVLEKMPWNHVS